MRKLAVLAWLSFASGCYDDPLDAKTWIKKLNDPREQKEAVRQLVKLKDKQAVGPLGELFKKSHSPEHLKAVASFLDPSSVPLLIESLEYSEEQHDNASIAATALGEIGDKSAVEPLIKAALKPLPVTTSANVVKLEAMKALAKLKDPRAVDALIKVVSTPSEEQDFFLNKVAARSLGDFADPRAVPALVRGLFMSGSGKTAGANIYQECRHALILIGEPAVDKLVETMQRKNVEVEADAKKNNFFAGIVVDKSSSMLGELRAKKAVPALLEQLNKKDEGEAAPPGQGTSEHQPVLIALGQIGDPSAVKPLIAILADSKRKYKERASACDALNMIGDLSALPALATAAKLPWLKGTTIDPEAARIAAGAIINYSRLTDAAHADGITMPKLDAELAESDMGLAVKSANERIAVAKECKQDLECYGKYLSADKTPDKGEKAAFMLSRAGKPAVPILLKNLGTRNDLIRISVLFALSRVADASSADAKKALDDQIASDGSKPPLRRLVNEMIATRALLAH